MDTSQKMDTVHHKEVNCFFLRCHSSSLMNWSAGGWRALLGGLWGLFSLKWKGKRCLERLVMIAAFSKSKRTN